MNKCYLLRSYFSFFSIFFSIVSLQAQTGQWTWTSGDTALMGTAVYGTKGVPSPTNTPGKRQSGLSWTDKTGNLWLFGGGYYDGAGHTLNDLWKYDITTKEWTWISGDSIPDQNSIYSNPTDSAFTGIPGSRSTGVSWTDTSGNLWLFGFPQQLNYRIVNELWKYNIAANQWTSIRIDSGETVMLGRYGTKGISSPGNTPPAKYESVNWTDTSGNFWLFGGYAATWGSGVSQSDLWKYNIATNQWTWMSGDSAKADGNFGTKGVASSASQPFGKMGATSWTGNDGKLWLYGGKDWGGGILGGNMDDLWNYDIASGMWTWVSGDDTGGIAPSFGTKGISAAGNTPGATYRSAGFTDKSGNLWLFGNQTYNVGALYWNYLWKYNISTNEWAWISGDSLPKGEVFYKTSELYANDVPAGRFSLGGSWVDASGNFQILGGEGAASGSWGEMNDMWTFTVSSPLPAFSLNSFTGTQQGEQCNLKWSGRNEERVNDYQLERSTDKISYTRIASTKATGTGSYTFADNLSGIKYPWLHYRLKIVNKDSSSTYSSVVSVQIAPVSGFTMYPNPAKGGVRLLVNAASTGKAVVSIFNMNGKEISSKSFTPDGSTFTIPTDNLLTGMYTLKLIYNNTESVQTLMITK